MRLRIGDRLGGGVFVVEGFCIGRSGPERSFSSSWLSSLTISSPWLPSTLIGLFPSGSDATSVTTGWGLGEDGSRTADLVGTAGRGSGSFVTNPRSEESINGTRSELMRITGETLLADIACCNCGDSRGACLLSPEDILCLGLSA